MALCRTHRVVFNVGRARGGVGAKNTSLHYLLPRLFPACAETKREVSGGDVFVTKGARLAVAMTTTTVEAARQTTFNTTLLPEAGK